MKLAVLLSPSLANFLLVKYVHYSTAFILFSKLWQWQNVKHEKIFSKFVVKK